MPDFAAAFEAGQVAARNASTHRSEIEQVFGAVTQQLSKATGGALVLYRADVSGFFSLIESALTPAAEKKTGTKKQSVNARNVKAEDTSGTVLARWEEPHEGYPCVLTYDNSIVRCHDKDGVEAAFADFLSNAWVGDQLQKLLALPPKPAAVSVNTPGAPSSP